MIRFVYPNVDNKGMFIGKACYLSYIENKKPPEINNEKPKKVDEEKTIVNLSQIYEVTSEFIGDNKIVRRDVYVYEYKNKSGKDFFGASQGLAYALALISRAFDCSWSTGRFYDIWCTGVISYNEQICKGEVNMVQRATFVPKLEAFLKSNDSLFVVPLTNMRDPRALEIIRENDVKVLSISDLRKNPNLDGISGKAIIEVKRKELNSLFEVLFKTPCSNNGENGVNKKILLAISTFFIFCFLIYVFISHPYSQNISNKNESGQGVAKNFPNTSDKNESEQIATDNFPIVGWSTWGGIKADGNIRNQKVVFNGDLSDGKAGGYVIERRSPFESFGGKVIEFKIDGSGNCTFSQYKMFKFQINDIPLSPKENERRNLNDPAYVNVGDGTVSFKLPALINKAEFVFYNSIIEELEISGKLVDYTDREFD